MMREVGETTRTVCPYCGVGCGVLVTREEDGAVSVKGDPEHPANLGRLCSKGSALGDTIGVEGRGLYPQIAGEQVSWDAALGKVADAFGRAIAEHGPDSVAFYVSGQLLTEDYYIANKLMKGFIGSANIDTNSRLCMSSSVAGHIRAFGADTVPGTYEDLEKADLVILTGSNMAWCHPVLYQRIAAAKEKRKSMRVVVVDPRRTATCDIADMHLAVRPDGDVALFNGLLAHLVESGALDAEYVRNHTKGFPESIAEARKLTRAQIAERTGLSMLQLEAFYALFTRTEKVVTCYSQGVNQSAMGTDKVNAIINCHLATGRIGKVGTGPFSLTGQPNAMGGREVGGLANMLAAHLSIDNTEHVEKLGRFWNTQKVAAKPGLKAVDLFNAVADGRIKALWVMSTNPAMSMPDANKVSDGLKNCPFVVVSDMFANTETALQADVFLPAIGWGEKNGTVTNSERRISRQRAFLPVPGEARPDWWQLTEVGRRLGFASAFDFAGPAEVFAEHAALSGFENEDERDFDISAHAEINQASYDDLSPFQWPAPGDAESTRQVVSATADGQQRFFADGGFYTADRKARFVAVTTQEKAPTDDAGFFVLNTGRVRDHWHTMTRTGRSAKLSSHLAEPFVEIHPADAADHNIESADLVRVSGQNGSVVLRALLTDRQLRGSLFVPMHWSGEFSGNARVDTLPTALADPHSGQPALKQSLASISVYKPAKFMFLASRLRPKFEGVTYWATAKTKAGWRSEMALDNLPIDWEVWCRDQLGLDDDCEELGYGDQTSGIRRQAFFLNGQLEAALYVANTPVAVSRNWIVSQFDTDIASPRQRTGILAGRPGADQKDPGATVCACFEVGINQITDAVRSGCHSVAAVGAANNAGTNCGSCRAEIRRIIDDCLIVAAE